MAEGYISAVWYRGSFVLVCYFIILVNYLVTSHRRFAVSAPTLWNSLQLSVRDPSMTLTQFCACLKTVLSCRACETLA